MQTNALPNLTATLTANPAAAGASGRNSVANGDQFGSLLSHELTQRQTPPAAPKAEAPRPQAPKPARTEASKPAERAPAQAAQAGAANGANKPQGTAKADEAEEAEEAKADDAKAEEAADPAAAMLALMASLQPQAADAGKKEADAGVAAAFDALTGARGKRGDAAQLAALQAAMKGAGTAEGGADGVFARTFAAIGKPTNPALAAAGAALAGDDRTAVAAGADGADTGAQANVADAARLQASLRGMEGGAQAQPHEAEQAQAELALRAARDLEQASPAAVQAAQLQPAALEAAQAAGAGAADQLRARVGTNAWENQVGQKVVWMVGSEEQTASLTLNPPDLGPMQVVLSVTNDQASVTFSSNHEEVRQALENALPRLREMMGENGIALGNATVNAGMPDGRQGQEQQARGGRWSGPNRQFDESVTTGEAIVKPARTRAIGDNGVVDTFA